MQDVRFKVLHRLQVTGHVDDRRTTGLEPQKSATCTFSIRVEQVLDILPEGLVGNRFVEPALALGCRDRVGIGLRSGDSTSTPLAHCINVAAPKFPAVQPGTVRLSESGADTRES